MITITTTSNKKYKYHKPKYVCGIVKRRCEEEMMIRILEISKCAEGANVTKIVYSANLNFKSASFLIEKLLKFGMLEKVNGKDARYRTTDKGLKAIEKFRDFSKMFK